MGARDVAEAFARNIMSNGAKIHGVSGDDQQAELHFNWPPENMLWPDTTIADTDYIADLTCTIASQIGMECEWQLQDGTVVLKFNK